MSADRFRSLSKAGRGMEQLSKLMTPRTNVVVGVMVAGSPATVELDPVTGEKVLRAVSGIVTIELAKLGDV